MGKKRATLAILLGLALAVNLPFMGICAEEKEIKVESIEDVNNYLASGLDSLPEQLDNLYKEIGESLNIGYNYVKMTHLLAGGKAVYADKKPNIYVDLAVDTVKAPFEIEGVKQEYKYKANWAYCPDMTIERPNKYYLPDAGYNVMVEITKLMNSRLEIDRGILQDYFNSLKDEVKMNIVYYEAILKYLGYSDEAVNNFYKVYERIIYMKQQNENVIEQLEDGTFRIKDKFKQVFIQNKIENPDRIAVILSFDSSLAISSDVDSIKSVIKPPFKVGYTSRENMMIASMSVIGKVRYIWGGGHLGTCEIEGINPVWKRYNEVYERDEEGKTRCIMPVYSWCPIHGVMYNTANACLVAGDDIANTVEEYLKSRERVLGKEFVENEKYKEVLKTINWNYANIVSHRIDGLDCSGYASWLYNQIDKSRVYDCGARGFVPYSGLEQVKYGEKMLPGDVLSWGTHIVVIVGQLESGSKAYIMTEAAPNILKFGVIYYPGASEGELERARSLAREANSLFGNIREEEKVNCYNILGVGHPRDENSSPAVDSEGKVDNYIDIGRLKKSFIDEKTKVYNGKAMKDMNAYEIINYTANNIGIQYLSGIDTYKGTLIKLDTESMKTTANTEIKEGIEKFVGIKY